MEGFKILENPKGGVLLEMMTKDGFVRTSKLHDADAARLFAKAKLREERSKMYNEDDLTDKTEKLIEVCKHKFHWKSFWVGFGSCFSIFVLIVLFCAGYLIH